MKKTILLSTVAAFGLMLAAAPAKAETVTTKTVVQTENVPGIREVDFTVFDVNKDGSYSMREVGERLYKTFDKDDNGMIDNMEWKQKSLMTITPMKKETFKYVDYDDDGLLDATSYTYENFYQESGLAKFDNNKNGLSAAEFIGVGYQTLDSNDDNLISLSEWKSAYLASRPKLIRQENYN